MSACVFPTSFLLIAMACVSRLRRLILIPAQLKKLLTGVHKISSSSRGVHHKIHLLDITFGAFIPDQYFSLIWQYSLEIAVLREQPALSSREGGNCKNYKP